MTAWLRRLYIRARGYYRRSWQIRNWLWVLACLALVIVNVRRNDVVGSAICGAALGSWLIIAILDPMRRWYRITIREGWRAERRWSRIARSWRNISDGYKQAYLESSDTRRLVAAIRLAAAIRSSLN